MEVPGPNPPGFIAVRSTRPLSPKETAEFLKKALFDQWGIALEHIDEKHVALKMRHQK